MPIYSKVFILFRDVLFQDHEAWTSFLSILFVRMIKHQWGLIWQVGSGGLFQGLIKMCSS